MPDTLSEMTLRSVWQHAKAAIEAGALDESSVPGLSLSTFSGNWSVPLAPSRQDAIVAISFRFFSPPATAKSWLCELTSACCALFWEIVQTTPSRGVFNQNRDERDETSSAVYFNLMDQPEGTREKRRAVTEREVRAYVAQTKYTTNLGHAQIHDEEYQDEDYQQEPDGAPAQPIEGVTLTDSEIAEIGRSMLQTLDPLIQQTKLERPKWAEESRVALWLMDELATGPTDVQLELAKLFIDFWEIQVPRALYRERVTPTDAAALLLTKMAQELDIAASSAKPYPSLQDVARARDLSVPNVQQRCTRVRHDVGEYLISAPINESHRAWAFYLSGKCFVLSGRTAPAPNAIRERLTESAIRGFDD